jgi:hypothetical protein
MQHYISQSQVILGNAGAMQSHTHESAAKQLRRDYKLRDLTDARAPELQTVVLREHAGLALLQRSAGNAATASSSSSASSSKGASGGGQRGGAAWMEAASQQASPHDVLFQEEMTPLSPSTQGFDPTQASLDTHMDLSQPVAESVDAAAATRIMQDVTRAVSASNRRLDGANDLSGGQAQHEHGAVIIFSESHDSSKDVEIPPEFIAKYKHMHRKCVALFTHFWNCYPVSHASVPQLKRVVAALEQSAATIQEYKTQLLSSHDFRTNQLSQLFHPLSMSVSACVQKFNLTEQQRLKMIQQQQQQQQQQQPTAKRTKR